MIRQMFKLIWNRKRSNLLMILEITLSFIVLFAVGSMVFYGVSSYYQPLGFDYENVWTILLERNSNNEQVGQLIKAVQRELLNDENVINVTPSDMFYPYSLATVHATHGNRETGESFRATPFEVDDNFLDVMGVVVTEGRWFSDEDDVSTLKPIVINKQLREDKFGTGPVIGETLIDSYRIIGVVDNYRFYGELDEPGNCFFLRNNIDHLKFAVPAAFLIRVRSGSDKESLLNLERKIAAVVPKWTIGVQPMTELRDFYFKTKIIPIIIFGIVAGFLIFNVGLGLFGVLWYSINRRQAEIGLRRALGANKNDIAGQIVGEALVLTTFGILIGIFVALQVPILGIFAAISLNTYLLAIVCSVVLIYTIITVCAYYPGRVASKIHPATALHYE